MPLALKTITISQKQPSDCDETHKTEQEIDFLAIQRTDIPEIMPLLHSLGRQVQRPEAVVASEEQIANLLFCDHPPAIGFVARSREGQLLGYSLVAQKFSSFRGEKILYIEDIVIAEAARGMGLGRLFMAFLADYARTNAFTQLDWIAEKTNRVAPGFYDHLGADRDDSSIHFTLDAEKMDIFANWLK